MKIGDTVFWATHDRSAGVVASRGQVVSFDDETVCLSETLARDQRLASVVFFMSRSAVYPNAAEAKERGKVQP